MDSTLPILMLAGLVTGFSKFSVGGMGLLILPVVMMAFPGPEALAVIIPMYLVTDLMAVSAYRKGIAWPVVARVLPLALAGVAVGSWFLAGIDAEEFTLILGVIIVTTILLGLWLDHHPAGFMRHPAAAYGTGFLAGFVSFVANAAGPLFSLFLVEQKLSKQAYVSTRAWLFLFINLSKIPALYLLGLLDWEIAAASVQTLPGLLVGAAIGYWVLRRLSLTQFKWLIRAMAGIAAVKLALS